MQSIVYTNVTSFLGGFFVHYNATTLDTNVPYVSSAADTVAERYCGKQVDLCLGKSHYRSFPSS